MVKSYMIYVWTKVGEGYMYRNGRERKKISTEERRCRFGFAIHPVDVEKKSQSSSKGNKVGRKETNEDHENRLDIAGRRTESASKLSNAR